MVGLISHHGSSTNSSSDMAYIQHIKRCLCRSVHYTVYSVQSMDIECQYRYMEEGKGSFSCVAALLERVLVNTTAHDASQRGERVVVQPLVPTLATPFNNEKHNRERIALMEWLLCMYRYC